MNILLLLVSFVSGILTVLAPCVLPLLPVIIGSSVEGKSKWKPFIITSSLALSVTLFTLLLKASTLLIDIDTQIWKNISGGLVIVFGITYLFPDLWSTILAKIGIGSSSDKLLEKASEKNGFLQPILVGMALGPVFASCSPTYALILATVLPVNFWSGLLYIIVYSLGLALVMLAISILGRSVIKNLKAFSNPNGIFKKSLGVIFLIVGISVISGFDKVVETAILDSNFFDVTAIEQNILESTKLQK
jgi:cytochrome c-type biogenesis protein